MNTVSILSIIGFVLLGIHSIITLYTIYIMKKIDLISLGYVIGIIGSGLYYHFGMKHAEAIGNTKDLDRQKQSVAIGFSLMSLFVPLALALSVGYIMGGFESPRVQKA